MDKFEQWLDGECQKLALTIISLETNEPQSPLTESAREQWILARRILRKYWELTPKK